MTAVSLSQLELAAEQTIAAAAAALLWAGPDSLGVLEHVAGTTAAQMAKLRCEHTFVRASLHDALSEDRPALVTALRSIEVSDFDSAALPAWAVPTWATAVRVALCAAYADSCEIATHRQGVVLWHALTMCSLWGWDPVPLNDIGLMARAVGQQTEQFNTGQF